MQRMTISQATKEIANTLRRARDAGRPGSLLIGAGVSKAGGIPLASELVAEIKREFATNPKVIAVDPNESHAYGKLMEVIGSNERRDLLQRYFTKAKVNWANVAVAQLLAQDLIGSVLTVNFDPLLAKACALVGVYPAVYDFSRSRADEKLQHLARPSIVHLHGQSSGFVLLNAAKETKAHASKLAPVVRHCVQQGPLVVLGYSGGADGVFTTLANCYCGEEQLYWLGYDEAPNDAVGKFLARSTCAFTPKVDADRFLIELAQEFKIWPPKVFDAPIVHLLDSLEMLTAYPVGGERGATFDLLASHRRNLEWMRDAEGQRRGRIEGLTTAYLEGRYEEVVQRVEVIQRTGPVDRETLDLAYWSALGMGTQLAEAGDYTAAIRWEERATALSDEPHEALYNWGLSLAAMARLSSGEEAERLFSEACDKYGRAIVIKPDDNETLNNWGIALAGMATLTAGVEAERFYAEACDKFYRAVALKPDQHRTAYNWGITVADKAKRATGDEAVELLMKACEQYRCAVEIRPDYYEARNNWGVTLVEMAKRARGVEAEKHFALACEQYRRAVEIDPDYHEAFNNWGVALVDMARRAGREEEADALLAKACEKYCRAVEIEPEYHAALNNWSVALLALAQRRSPEKRAELFAEAAKKLAVADNLMPSQTSYNLACLMALTGRPDACRDKLQAAHLHGTLPSRAHLETDTDLDAVRNLPWFTEILALAKVHVAHSDGQ